MPERPHSSSSRATMAAPHDDPMIRHDRRNRQVYAATFIDAIVVKVWDGQVANLSIYVAIGVSLDGHRDVLDLWAGDGGEGAKFWMRMSVLADIRNKGTPDVFVRFRDGSKGLPEVVESVRPATTVQTCVIHLIRNTFRLSSRQHWDRVKHDLKPILPLRPRRRLKAAQGGCERRDLANAYLRCILKQFRIVTTTFDKLAGEYHAPQYGRREQRG